MSHTVETVERVTSSRTAPPVPECPVWVRRYRSVTGRSAGRRRPALMPVILSS